MLAVHRVEESDRTWFRWLKEHLAKTAVAKARSYFNASDDHIGFGRFSEDIAVDSGESKSDLDQALDRPTSTEGVDKFLVNSRKESERERSRIRKSRVCQ
jgi:hypothetical protein